MANIKSQKKRIRQDEKKNLRNKDKKTALRTSITVSYTHLTLPTICSV